MLKNGTQVSWGRKACANAKATGEVIQETFMTGMKPARTVARIWWNVRAPAIMAMLKRYTAFWMGEIYAVGSVNAALGCTLVRILQGGWKQ